jgi:hypothetical protein
MTKHTLGKIYEFSVDEYFINKTVGILIGEDNSLTNKYEFIPILQRNTESQYADYIREVSYSIRDYLFGVETND